MTLEDELCQAVNDMYREGYRFVLVREVVTKLGGRATEGEVAGLLDGLIPEDDRHVARFEFLDGDGEPTALRVYVLKHELPRP